MEHKKSYEQPAIVVVRLESEHVIAMSATDGGLRGTVSDNEATGGWANVRQRDSQWADYEE